MHKLGIIGLAGAMIGMAMSAASANGVEVDTDEVRMKAPEHPTNHPSAGKKPKKKQYAALPHERPATREKSESLKRMLGRKRQA